jgi:hypothetical protein
MLKPVDVVAMNMFLPLTSRMGQGRTLAPVRLLLLHLHPPTPLLLCVCRPSCLHIAARNIGMLI